MSRIPKILHFTFGMAPDFGGKPWGLVHHVCLKSAIERIRPEKVFFYFEFEPTGLWWELSRELVTSEKIEAPREIFGNPLIHVAHRSDVLRLQKLIERGGIYLDTDVFVHRDFDDLLNNSVVLGQEGVDGEVGLANAVILAEPNAPFLRRWFDEYRSFRSKGNDEFWNEHSVVLPKKLAREYPDEITILPHTAFFWPLWSEEHIVWIFESRKPIPLDNSYGTHLWESKSWRYFEGLTLQELKSIHSNFHRWARPLIVEVPKGYGALPFSGRLRRAWKRIRTKLGRTRSRLRRRSVQVKAIVRSIVVGDRKFRQHIFRDVYQRNLWGNDGQSKYFSGTGSRGAAAKTYVEEMGQLLANHASRLDRPLIVVDLGCGDFQVGAALVGQLSNIVYVGCDIVPELIAEHKRNHASERVSFQHIDIVSDPIPEGDVYLIRQVLQHLSNSEISRFMERMDGRCLYVTEGHPAARVGPVNPDKPTGASVRFDWRTGRGRGLELDQSPFGLTTREMFRVASPPHEVIVTELVCPAPASSSRREKTEERVTPAIQ